MTKITKDAPLRKVCLFSYEFHNFDNEIQIVLD